jgi:hypothetical protein
MDLVRLACVRHAASVRPEPGSNSPSRSCPGNFIPEGDSEARSRSESRFGVTSPHQLAHPCTHRRNGVSSGIAIEIELMGRPRWKIATTSVARTRNCASSLPLSRSARPPWRWPHSPAERAVSTALVPAISPCDPVAGAKGDTTGVVPRCQPGLTIANAWCAFPRRSSTNRPWSRSLVAIPSVPAIDRPLT